MRRAALVPCLSSRFPLVSERGLGAQGVAKITKRGQQTKQRLGHRRGQRLGQQHASHLLAIPAKSVFQVGTAKRCPALAAQGKKQTESNSRSCFQWFAHVSHCASICAERSAHRVRGRRCQGFSAPPAGRPSKLLLGTHGFGQIWRCAHWITRFALHSRPSRLRPRSLYTCVYWGARMPKCTCAQPTNAKHWIRHDVDRCCTSDHPDNAPGSAQCPTFPRLFLTSLTPPPRSPRLSPTSSDVPRYAPTSLRHSPSPPSTFRLPPTHSPHPPDFPQLPLAPPTFPNTDYHNGATQRPSSPRRCGRRVGPFVYPCPSSHVSHVIAMVGRFFSLSSASHGRSLVPPRRCAP